MNMIENVMQRIIASMSVAVTTFVSQNIGSGKEKRIRKGVNTALLLTGGVVAVLSALIIVFKGPLIALFDSNDAEVLQYASLMIWVQTPMQVVDSVAELSAGELRGRGRSKIPMAVIMFFYIVVRQAYLRIGWPYFRSLLFVLTCFPLMWVMSAAALTVMARSLGRKALAESRLEAAAGR